MSRCLFSQRLEKEGILDPVARGNVHFQQHAWRYFAFKPLLRCSDDRSLPLVEKICDSICDSPSGRQSPDRRLFFCAAFTSYCWFSLDVTKIQTKKLSILPRFYFHDVLEQLKTNFHTNSRFKRVLGFVIEYA